MIDSTNKKILLILGIAIVIYIFIMCNIPMFVSSEKNAEKQEETTKLEHHAPEVKYEVSINVVYNAVNPQKAVELHSKAIIQHQNACKVEVITKKVDGNQIVNTEENDLTFFNCPILDAAILDADRSVIYAQ